MGPDDIHELTFIITAVLLIGMPSAMEVGRRVRRASDRHDRDATDAGVGALDTAVYALFGLLLAFVFSGAASRFDDRRQMIAEEANAVGTAWLRIDLLPQDTQARLRPLFRTYLESRLATHRLAGEPDAAAAQYQRGLQLQNEIWSLAVAGAREAGSPAVLSLVLPALNDMIDITTIRLAAMHTHPPKIIYGMLVLVALAASFLSGMAMARSAARPWPHILAFTLVISATVYVIFDIENPRRGFIRIDAADQVLIDLLTGMQPDPPTTGQDR